MTPTLFWLRKQKIVRVSEGLGRLLSEKEHLLFMYKNLNSNPNCHIKRTSMDFTMCVYKFSIRDRVRSSGVKWSGRNRQITRARWSSSPAKGVSLWFRERDPVSRQ